PVSDDWHLARRGHCRPGWKPGGRVRQDARLPTARFARFLVVAFAYSCFSPSANASNSPLRGGCLHRNFPQKKTAGFSVKKALRVTAPDATMSLTLFLPVRPILPPEC